MGGILPEGDDYRLEVREAFQQGPVVVLLGVARGTYAREGTLRAEGAWERPSAWRAVVREGRVAEWQVYADNEPIPRRGEGAFRNEFSR